MIEQTPANSQRGVGVNHITPALTTIITLAIHFARRGTLPRSRHWRTIGP